ncbi:Retrovirus-related Pol polyprotein from transposon TNT 1-94 [Podarcis lilfordi]|uniref:Retrovirus-related Pol polyprotein from transposon TNT 1-94 n=1 Tax=Podarcis lilfordi TaxID=74358 RepID=A0AA35L0F5_9SAUR|nr:Retrovirus-related Pol polyprotein from transposon TNT 1-94 [Podarcis lilfordi]
MVDRVPEAEKALVFPQLTDENYSLWSFRVEALLTSREVWTYVTDDPPDPVTNAWSKGDAKARAIINLAVSDQQVVYIRNKKTAKEMWDGLAAVHVRKESASALTFFKQLFQTKLQPGGDLAAHLRRLEAIRGELIRRDMEIPDIQYVFIILCSLNEDFDGIASQISAVPPAQLTVEGVTARLMGELDRREACAISTPISRKNEERHMQTCGDTTAFKAAKRCLFWNKQGHFAKDCRSKRKQSTPKSVSVRQSRSSAQQPASYRKDRNEPRAFHASTRDRKRIKGAKWNSFLVDSGASQHVCNDRSLFISFEEEIDSNGIDNTEEEEVEEAAAAAAGNGASELMEEDKKPVESDNFFDDLKSQRVVMYLKHTKHYRLQFTTCIDKGFEIFCDASHAVEQNNCRGVSGMVFCYNGCPFEWKSQTQTIVCLSTTESELCACVQATRDVEWYLQVFADLQMQVTLPVKVYLDSQSGLAILCSETNTQRTKVLRLRLQFVKKLIADEMVVFKYVPGDNQIADIFTKALPKGIHEKHVQSMLYVFVPQ